MKSVFAVTLVAACGPAVPVNAQSTLDWPTSQYIASDLDSGALDNPGGFTAQVFAEPVTVAGAGGLRLHFGEGLALGQGSVVRVTAMRDGEQQVLDAATAAVWGNATAYFNGDTVLVELIAGPGTAGNRVALHQVEVQPAVQPVGDPGQCGICGPDDRVQSSELWSSRLFPAGCTASVYNTDSCMVTAGHCIGSGMTVQFNVPDSDPDCGTNNPPVADQFPIIMDDSVNGGVGNDWAVLIPGPNSLGELPYQRYGELRPIATQVAPLGGTAEFWGYGVNPSPCDWSQTQQYSVGEITFVSGTHYEFDADVRGGNSGSALMHDDEIIGIVTHCSVGCPNYGTRSDLASFAQARDDLCPSGIGFDFPGGLPDLSDPDGGTTIQVVVVNGGDDPAPGTGMVHVSANGAPFVASAMTQNDPNDYEAALPPADCGAVLRYYFSAETAGGQTQTSPAGAPDGFYEAIAAGALQVVFSDDFESDQGWSVSGTASDGQWDRGVPIPHATCERGNPDADADGSGQCYLTDNSSANACNSDVDGGSTILTSPVMDATGDTVVRYHRWYDNSFGSAPFEDVFAVEVSDDGGSSWTSLEDVGPSGVQVTGGWYSRSFRVGGAVTPNSQFRIRFIASDADPQSVVEAAVDGVELAEAICEAAACPWDCGAPADGDVSIEDFLALLGTWGEVGAPCDFDGGGVGITDFLKLLGMWGTCP